LAGRIEKDRKHRGITVIRANNAPVRRTKAAILTTAHSVIEPTVDRSRSGWDVLSLMRFFLAFIVALTHLKDFSPLGPLAWIEQLGSLEAILGFLLISGYSIGHSIQKRPDGYFLRRMWRIYPVFLAATALTYAIQLQTWTGGFTAHFIANLFFLGQIVDRNSYVGPAWTLDLEVWLYCLAPLLLRCRPRALEWLISISVACYAAYTVGRTLFHFPYYAVTVGGINLPCLAFIWIAGFYLSISRDKKRPLRIIGLLFLAHFVLTAGIQFAHRIRHHELKAFVFNDLSGFGSIALLLLFILIVFRGVAAHRFHLAPWPSRVCRFLGNISYPLYLVHYAVFSYAVFYFSNSIALLLSALAVSIAVYLSCDFYSRRRELVSTSSRGDLARSASRDATPGKNLVSDHHLSP
jgi:peptidoglycan/LPS O-acetylase OafA/YrhL